MYIGDDHIIVCLQGLRWVSKEDKVWSMRETTTYTLQLAYKGMTKEITYPLKNDRDEMYDRIRKEIAQK